MLGRRQRLTAALQGYQIRRCFVQKAELQRQLQVCSDHWARRFQVNRLCQCQDLHPSHSNRLAHRPKPVRQRELQHHLHYKVYLFCLTLRRCYHFLWMKFASIV
jgi:hypothetical protein